MKKIFSLIALAIFFSAPLGAFAVECTYPLIYDSDTGTCVASVLSGSGINQTYIQSYKDLIIWTINSVLVPVLMAIAFIVFLYGVYKYFILGGDSDTERATGRQFVLWGIIGFVIITTMWGLVSIVSSTLNLTPGGSAASRGLNPPTI